MHLNQPISSILAVHNGNNYIKRFYREQEQAQVRSYSIPCVNLPACPFVWSFFFRTACITDLENVAQNDIYDRVTGDCGLTSLLSVSFSVCFAFKGWGWVLFLG